MNRAVPVAWVRGAAMAKLPNHYHRNNIAFLQSAQKYQKRSLTPAVRIDGPFAVDTPHGTVTCQDGWLAVDAMGWPYPIAADEFEAIYMPVGYKDTPRSGDSGAQST